MSITRLDPAVPFVSKIPGIYTKPSYNNRMRNFGMVVTIRNTEWFEFFIGSGRLEGVVGEARGEEAPFGAEQ